MKEFKVEYDLYGSTIDSLKGHYIEYFNTKDEALYFINDGLKYIDSDAFNIKLFHNDKETSIESNNDGINMTLTEIM